MCNKLSGVPDTGPLAPQVAALPQGQREAIMELIATATSPSPQVQDWLQFIDSARASLDMAEMVIQKAVHPATTVEALNRSHDYITDAMDTLRHALMWAEKNRLPITQKNLQHVRDFCARMAFFK